MDIQLLHQIQQLNPWFADSQYPIFKMEEYVSRQHSSVLMDKEWDALCTVLVGPRQSGKTTLGKFLCQKLVHEQRFPQLLYLNCDLLDVRGWLTSPQFLKEAEDQFGLKRYILFIDEVQRLENPGLLLKALVDLALPIKLIVSGSSQLEIKSRVQEFLTGRHLESVVLPFSIDELHDSISFEERIIYGSYPRVVRSSRKPIVLRQLYDDYISKDIIEILRVGKPDIMQKLIGLVAHSSGQLINYNQLAIDCKVSIPTVQNYLSILEKTYVLMGIRPFVGNKRTEITSNPIYYFIDNGFRNQALRNFSSLNSRADRGLLIQSFVFQELMKLKTSRFLDFEINFWRTKAGAEVDFVLKKQDEMLIPIEAKYKAMKEPKLTRGFRSFISAYKPKHAAVITKAFMGTRDVDGCTVRFIPLEKLADLMTMVEEHMSV